MTQGDEISVIDPREDTDSVVPAEAPDLSGFMLQVFPELSGSAIPARANLGRRDYEAAFDLLARVADGFQLMAERCQSLEEEIRTVQRHASDSVKSAEGETKRWQHLATTLKTHLDDCEKRLAEMAQRVKVAESRLAAGQELVMAAEQHASAAIDLTTLFHDKIVAAFGAGSKAHAALALVAPSGHGDTQG